MRSGTVIARLFALVLLPAVGHGALVAEYTFATSDGTDSSGSANSYDLAASTGTAAPTYQTENGNTFVHFAGHNGGADGQALITAAGALEANDDDGNSAWIVSLWFRTDDWTQGSYRGIFSTADSNTATRGWQLDSTGGAGRVVRNNGGGSANNATFNWSAQPTVGDWHHLYLIKRSNTDWELYLDRTSVVADTTNVGRVDEIRLGTIRGGGGTINGLRMDMDYVQVWDATNDAGSDLDTAYNAGLAHLVPEPSTGLLASLALLPLFRRRR